MPPPPHTGSPHAAALCPEFRLLTHGGAWAAWQNGGPDVIPTDVPYWDVIWPGGQALARYILDNPSVVAGGWVADCGAGAGLAALAAAQAGARRVVAIDRDPRAIDAIRENAAVNGVAHAIDLRCADLRSLRLDAYDVILAGDLWYERFAAAQITTRLREAVDRGADVLIGDNARAFAPRRGTTVLAQYVLAADPHIESTESTRATVARLHGAASLLASSEGAKDDRTV